MVLCFLFLIGDIECLIFGCQLFNFLVLHALAFEFGQNLSLYLLVLIPLHLLLGLLECSFDWQWRLVQEWSASWLVLIGFQIGVGVFAVVREWVFDGLPELTF